VSDQRPPARIRVTSPQMAGLRRATPSRPATREIDEQTEVGELYLSGLLRAQLRAGLALLSLVMLGLGGLPVLFLLLPRVAGHPVGPVSVAWLLLGVLVYPALLLAAWWQVRTAERIERDFITIMRRR
jgi:hypothetical protein